MSKLINKYKNIAPEIKASLWFAVCVFMQKGISLLTLPIFTRILSTDEYGLVTLYSSWYSIFTIIATLNLSAGVFTTAYVKIDTGNKDEITSSFLGLSTFVTTVFFIIYILFQKLINKLTGLNTLLTVFMFLEMYIVPAYNFWATEQKFKVKYRKLVVITMIVSILSPLVGVGAVVLSREKAVAKIIAGVIIQIIVYGVLYINIVRRGKKLFNKKTWIYGITFALPLLLHYFSLSILNQSDRIMISNYVGKDKAGIYNVAYNVATIVSLFFTGVNYSLTPWMMKKIKSQEYLDINSKIKVILPFIAAIIFCFSIFEPEVIAIFASKEYYESIWVLPPITAGLYFTFLNTIFLQYEFYFEMKFLITISSSIAALFNIVLNAIFIPLYGYIAAGYTTMVCYMVLALVHYFAIKYISRRKLDNVKLFDIKYILFVSILLVAIVLANILLYKNRIVRYSIALLICIIIVLFRKKIFKIIKTIK